METNKFRNKIAEKIKKIKSFAKKEYNGSFFYHYTSPESFKDIIVNKELCLSDVNFLNDKEENNYIYKVLVDILLNNTDNIIIGYLILIILHIKGRIDIVFLNRIEKSKFFNQQEKEKLLKEYFITSCKKQNINESESIFCFSASLKKDSLPMWNYYIKNDKYCGYNIGFNINKLKHSILSLNNFIYEINKDPFGKEVIYDINKQKQIILKILSDFIVKNNITDTSNLISKLNNKFDFNELIDKLLFEGIFFKSECFNHEEEYRIVVKIKDIYSKEKKVFFIKNGIFIPRIKISFDKTAINNITIAPLVEKDIAKRGLEQFLINNGYEVYNEQTKTGIKIETSNCPIRY